MALLSCFFAMVCVIIVTTLVASSRTPTPTAIPSDNTLPLDLSTFIKELNSYPNEISSKMQMDDLHQQFESNWLSKLYGGSVFDPVN